MKSSDFSIATELSRQDNSFNSLIMAAITTATPEQYKLLTHIFPKLVAAWELYNDKTIPTSSKCERCD